VGVGVLTANRLAQGGPTRPGVIVRRLRQGGGHDQLLGEPGDQRGAIL